MSRVPVKALHGPGILLFPFLRDLIQCFPACLFGWCVVNGFQIIGECFPIFVRHVFQRVAYLMDDAALVIGLGIRSSDGSADLGQSVRAQDQDVLYAAVFQFIQHGQPVPGAFIFANLDGQWYNRFSPNRQVPAIGVVSPAHQYAIRYCEQPAFLCHNRFYPQYSGCGHGQDTDYW